MADLTDKQQRFIDAYLTCWNGAEAARRAGYPAASARQIASENLSKPDIRAAIEERLQESAMPAREVLARLTEIARSSLGDFFSVKGRGVAVDIKKAMAADSMHLLKKYSRGKDGTITIELHDAMAALQLLGKHHRLFTDLTELSGAIGYKIYEKSDDFNPEDA